MPTRQIQEHLQSRPTMEGAGVHLRRAFGFPQVPLFDPFLMLDEFHSDNPADYLPGFPWHPHRGMETITYVLEGRIEHRDSIGNVGEIGPGDVQWMTAGSGIIHQEMPRQTPSGVLWGCQLWANLPAVQKMMPPRYREVKAAEIPVLTLPGDITVKVISGAVQGIQGPVRDIVTDPEFLDVAVPAHAGFTHAVKPGYTVFAYVIDGAANFGNGEQSATGSVILYAPEGDSITVTTADQPVRFFLCSGKPLGEPIAWQGPIVMNTREELQEAFREFNNGTFVKR